MDYVDFFKHSFLRPSGRNIRTIDILEKDIEDIINTKFAINRLSVKVGQFKVCKMRVELIG